MPDFFSSIIFIKSNTQMQHCYCERVLEHRLNAEDVRYKSLITDQYVFKAYG